MGALRLDGAVAAAVIGFIVFGWGGVGGALPLLLFFVSASTLTKMRTRLRPPAEDVDGTGRGAVQVLVNGLVPAGAVLGFAVTSDGIWLVAFAGALAAVTADTWATELGGLSARRPVLVTTGKPVAPGRSGAVSLWGTLGGIAGAFFLAFGAGVSMVRWPLGVAGDGLAAVPGPGSIGFLVAAAGGGVLGMIGDSLLGATVQARYFCSACGKETEQSVHRCGTSGVRVAGLFFMTNDTVNLAASIIGAATAALIWKGIVG